MKRTQERSGGGASELRRREPAEGEAGERILDHLLEGCQIIGFDWRYLYLNDVAAKHGRRRQDELVGRTMMECFPGIEQAPFFANLRDCMEHRRPHQVESEFTYPDGSRAWFELRIEPVPQGSFVLSLDISQRKRDDSRIGHLNAVLRGIRDVNQLIVRERDPEVLMARTSELLVEARGFRAVTIVLGEPGALRHRSAGEGTARLAALAELLDRGELPGCLADALELRTPQVRQPPSGDCASCPANLDFGLGRDIVALPIAYEGRSFGGLLVAIPEGMASEAEEMDLLREVAGDLAFALANGELRAERSRLEAQYLQAQKMEAIGRMAGGIAHDFNNLLAVVLGSADLALEDLAAESPSRADIEEIRRAAESGAQLTRQLLAFSRRQPMAVRVVDLDEVVRPLEGMLRRLLGDDVELTMRLAAGTGPVRVDPHQIEQVVMNLVVNARDAMAGGGKLTIESSDVELDELYAEQHTGVEPGSYAMLAVSDTGSGIDEAVRDRLFEPFFTTKEPGKGTGLGLATVYGIVKQSGGHIWVYSEPGHGATFRVYLPRHEGDRPGAAAPPPPLLRRGHETILLVEDQEALRRVVERILVGAGYRVLTAANGLEAFELSRCEPGEIELALTDVMMPGMGGAELVEELRRQRPKLRLLMMSGYAEETAFAGGAMGADVHFLPKPFTAAELTRALRAALGG